MVQKKLDTPDQQPNQLNKFCGSLNFINIKECFRLITDIHYHGAFSTLIK
jgi:hypothetical protein